MAAPSFVNAASVLNDTTADASPIATSAYNVSTSGHTLIIVVGHERASATDGSTLNISSITRNGQSATRILRYTNSGAGASNEVGDVWQIQNADTGTHAFSVAHTGTTGSDIHISVLEYDGGTVDPSKAVGAYLSGSVGVPADVDVDCPADSRLIYAQFILTGGTTWGTPAYGTSRFTSLTATGTAGSSMAGADYAVPSAGTVTNVYYDFTPYSGGWSSYGANLVIAFPLESAGTATEGTLSVSVGTITLAAEGVGPGTASEGALSASIGEVTLSAAGSGYLAPTISRPAGGGDVDVAATVVTGEYSAAPTIEMFGDPETNENITGDKWEGFYADVDLKQSGRTPTFKLDFSNWRVSTPPANNKLYWRYASDIGDLSAWQPFDSRSVAGSVLTVSNSTAFTESAIQIANIPPVPYDELEDWLTTWDANGNIYRPQACADLAISSSAPNKYAYYDFPDLVSPDGVQVGTTYAFAFGVTNPAATGPKKRLFHTWTHAGEWGGLRAMLRFAQRLMSVADADHDVLRDEFDHIFLLCNTAGMVGGMARGAAESGDVGDDPNRVWGSNAIDRSDVTDTILSIEASVDLLVTEWGVDGSNKINALGQIAWHSHTASSTKFGTYSTGFSAAESAFLGYLEAIYGSSLHNYGASSTGSSTAFSRTGTTGGFGVTFEWSYAFADFLNEIGTSVDTIGPALVDAFQAGYLGRTAQVDASIGAVTLSATGALDIAGTLSANIGTIGLSSAGALAIAGTASASIGAISLTATGELALATGTGTLSQSIGEISLSAAGTLPLTGVVSASIGTIALASTSKVAIAGALSASVGAVTLSSAARLAIAGSVNTSIGLITLSATNVAGIASPTPPERRAAAIGESRRAAA